MNRILALALIIVCTLSLILIGILTRLVPHPPNFTPILSFALLSSVYTKNNFGILIPVGIMILSDYFLGYHGTIVWVYTALFIIYLVGYYFIGSVTFKKILVGSFIGSLIFFLVTNLGVWFIGYPKTIEGFVQCYVLAIPFYKNTLLSTIFYSSIIHSCYIFISNSKLLASWNDYYNSLVKS